LFDRTVPPRRAPRGKGSHQLSIHQRRCGTGLTSGEGARSVLSRISKGPAFAGPYTALDSDGHLIVENLPKGAPCKLLKTERWSSIPSEGEPWSTSVAAPVRYQRRKHEMPPNSHHRSGFVGREPATGATIPSPWRKLRELVSGRHRTGRRSPMTERELTAPETGRIAHFDPDI
jgi:hypothetical protein